MIQYSIITIINIYIFTLYVYANVTGENNCGICAICNSLNDGYNNTTTISNI
jgi:hypothetical protein